MRDRLLILGLTAMLLTAGMACNALDRLFTPDEPEPADVAEDSSQTEQPDATDPPPTPTSIPHSLSGPECLVGSWDVDTDSYHAFLGSAFGEAAESYVDSIEGSMGIQFSDHGTATIETNLVLTFCVSGECLPIEIQQSGSSEYTASEGEVSLSGGEFFTAIFASPLGEVAGSSEMEGEGAGYACEDDSLTVFVEGFPDLIWNRVQ